MLQFEKKGAKIYALNLPRGDNGELELFVSGYDLKAGDKIIFKMGKDLNHPLIEKEITDFSGNYLAVSIFPDDTRTFSSGRYYYTVRLLKENGNVDTLIEQSDFILKEA